MSDFYIALFISLIIIILSAAWAGRRARLSGLSPTALGILIDERERFSLNRFQLVMWTVLILSTFLGLLFSNLASPSVALDIPSDLLALMGISVGSATVAGAVKDGKNTTRATSIAAGSGFLQLRAPTELRTNAVTPQSPRFSQVVLEEEGVAGQNQIVSIAKFQKFILTAALGVVYAVLVVNQDVPGYPELSEKVLWLIGISYAGYVGGKIPDKP